MLNQITAKPRDPASRGSCDGQAVRKKGELCQRPQPGRDWLDHPDRHRHTTGVGTRPHSPQRLAGLEQNAGQHWIMAEVAGARFMGTSL